jgi:hypothetical protein
MNSSEPVIRLATRTLANELGCLPEQIAIEDVTPVTWPSSALGCPQPDMMYLQVLTPGYRIRLSHAGRAYIVHTDRGQRAVRCDGGQEPLSHGSEGWDQTAPEVD